MKFINFDLLSEDDQDRVQNCIRTVCKKWKVKLPTEINISRRLKSVSGFYKIQTNIDELIQGKINVKMTLSLAYNHYKQFGADHFIKVLLHELAHHIQYIRSKKIEHDTEFKDICLALGGIMNEQLAQGKYRPCLSYKFIDTPNKYKYTCTGCGNIFYTKRKMDPKRICLKCGTSVSKFKLKELIKK